MPTTSYPSDFNNAAVAEESTPPDMATTILVSCGRPLRSRLLSMVPVIGAIAAASGASRLERRLANSQKDLQLECLAASPGPTSACRNGCKLLFNIGRIRAKQSARPVLHAADGQSCRRAEKD